MAIVHIVLFEFKPGTEPAAVQDVVDSFFSLKEKCLHPTTNKPYIKTSVGGRDNSPESMQGGITHGFVVEFESAEDRDFYVAKDPAHQDFIKSVRGVVARAQVIDFTPGVF